MKKSGIIRLAVIIVSSLILIFVTAVLLTERVQGLQADSVQKKTRAMYDAAVSTESVKTVDTVVFEEDTDQSKQGTETAELLKAEEHESPVPSIAGDMLELYETNPDLVGWIKAGDRIDYPVVLGDNRYYLKHDFYGKRTSNGNIFMNEANTLFPRDDIWLIHGHNMKSGAMFGTLKKFMKYEYLCRYPVITFRTIYDTEDVYYTPVAAFNASMHVDNRDYFNLVRIQFDDDSVDPNAPVTVPAEGATKRKSAEFHAYLDEIRSLSLWEPKTDVNEDDKIIVLITCSYFQANGRLMVVCRQLRDGETPESIQALYADDPASFNKK